MRAPVLGAILLAIAALASEADAQAPSQPRPTLPQTPAQLKEAAEIKQRHACKTRMTYAAIHGTQISYSSSDGGSFLWYPGNTIVLEGKWDIRHGSACFLYGTNTYNPATGIPGGNWECWPVRRLEGDTVELADGDIFGLSRRDAVPFVLPGVKATFAELQDHARLLAPDPERSPRPQDTCAQPRVVSMSTPGAAVAGARKAAEPPPEFPWHTDPAEIHKRERCKTRLTYTPDGATHVSYARSDGQIFRWRPDDHNVAAGRWEARPGAICFKYSLTGLPASWACTPAAEFDRQTVETADGDVLGLGRRSIAPFMLPKVKTTIAALQEAVRGASPPRGRTLPPDPGCAQ
jgi:hypothetical protein